MSATTSCLHGEAWHPYEWGAGAMADLDMRVHVWRIRLDTVSPHHGEALSDDERARADRFVWPEDRRRFVVTRAALRAILADCLGTRGAAGRLRLRYGPAGKPFLIDDPALGFNVSHSEDVALIAATRAGEVGIDIERQRHVTDMASVARLVFDEAERAAMLGCPPAAREAVFHRIWTRKEALLKAMGVGIAGLKNQRAVALALVSGAWQIVTIPHLDGFVAALARPRAARGVRLWCLSDPFDPADAGPQVSLMPPPPTVGGAAHAARP